jgi:CheY-like chemotaxis protein
VRFFTGIAVPVPVEIEGTNLASLSGMKSGLIVNEDKHLLYALYFTLKRIGFPVTTALTGNEAWEEIVRNPSEGRQYGFFIIDFQMPDNGNLSLVQKIRAAKIPSPILGITSFNNTRFLDNLKEAGCNHFLAKPFSIDDLMNKMLKITLENKLYLDANIT